MDSREYDRLMLQCLGDRHIKSGTVYYDSSYEVQLRKALEQDKLLEAYGNELVENSQGVKMCSIASSSRFCYLASKSIFKGIDTLEKSDIVNVICRPHYDAYDSSTKTFYEFKCHEFCQTRHDFLRPAYTPLLGMVFGIETRRPEDLKFSDFSIKLDNDPRIDSVHFDFKQLICHLIGLASFVTKDTRVHFEYIWVIPDVPDNTQLTDFIHEIEYEEMRPIMGQLSAMDVCFCGESGRLCDFVELGYATVRAQSIPDFILEGLDEPKI